jgi:hypothetical protein
VTDSTDGSRERPYQNVGSCDGICPPAPRPRCSPCPQLSTEDNRTPIALGMRLYNYYDGEWGTVTEMPTEYSNGWFQLTNDRGHRTSLNGVRVVADPEPKGPTNR